MDWVLWIIAVAVLGVGAVIASGRLGSMGPTVTDTPKPEFPAGPLSSGDLRDVRFAVVPGAIRWIRSMNYSIGWPSN